MLDNGKIVLKNDKGEEKVFDILFTFDTDETNKSYIAYTDNSLDASGNIQVFANTYDPNGEDLDLQQITTDKEWKVIDNILSSVVEMVKEQDDKEE